MDTKPNHNHNHYQRPHQSGQYTPSNPNHAGETNYPLLSHHYTPTSYGNGSGNYGNYGMSYDPLAPSVTHGGGGGAGQSGMLNGERNGESS
jgi:hypothetical protein